MSECLGDFPINGTVQCKWSTSLDGESITRATNGTLRVYKGASLTQRTSAAGITETEDFDTITGVHHITIDLADNTDAGFYAAGNEYQVVMVGMAISAAIVNAVIAHFSIERAGGVLALLKSVVSGAGVNVTQLAGVTQSLTDLKDFADDGYDPATNKVQGVVLTDTLATYTGNTLQTGDSFARLGATGSGLTSLATQASVTTIDDFLDTEVTTILNDLDDLQTRLPAALVAGRMDVSVGALNGSATAAQNLERSASSIYRGSITATSTSTSLVDSGLTQTGTDHWKGRIVIFTSGTLAGQATDILAFTPGTDTLTVTALTAAPATSDQFVIV